MSNNKQWINNNKTTGLEQTAGGAGGGGGGLNAFYWYQIFVLGYVVVKAQQLFGSHGKWIVFVIYIQVPVCLKNYQFTHATFAKYYIF